MANNQAQDRYNPPGIGEGDYEQTSFGELTNGELIWLKTDRGDDNHAYRKMNDFQALNTKTQEVRNFGRTVKVYYKM